MYAFIVSLENVFALEKCPIFWKVFNGLRKKSYTKIKQKTKQKTKKTKNKKQNK